MYPTETPVPKKSRRLLWVGIAAIVVTIFVVVAVAFVLSNSKKEEPTAATTPAATEATVATNEEVKQNLAVLDATIKQATADQAAAKAALKDGTNQIKVGN